MLAELQRVNQLNISVQKSCNIQYEQAMTYHQNFISLEREYNKLQQTTQQAVNDCIALVQRQKKDNQGGRHQKFMN